VRPKILLFAILVLAVLLRIPLLAQFPNGFSGDEASQGYAAYSILKTGHDEWGEFLPSFFRSFGEFKPPIYTYLTIPSIFFFDVGEFAVRLPAALIGVATVCLLYFVVQELFRSRFLSLVSCLLLAISPWHFQFSRTALEANLLPFFFLLSLFFFIKSQSQMKFLPLSALFAGLSFYTYQLSKIFIPLFFICALFLFQPKLKKETLVAILIFLILALPTFFSSQARFSDVSIFNPSQLSQLNDRRFACAQSLPDGVCRIFHNKVTFWTTSFFENYFSYFSFQFLFTGARPDFSYLNLPGTPLLYLFELPLILFGLFALRKEKFAPLLFLWIVLAPVPASLTTGTFHANRAVTFLPVFEIFAAAGALWLFGKLKTERAKQFSIFAFFLVAIVSLAFILESYFIRLPKNPAESLRYGYRQTIAFTESVKDQYEKIIFSKAYSEPQAFVAFYSKLDPKIYQGYSKDYLRYEKEGKKFVDQLESYQLGKYEFRDINWEKDKKIKNALLVGPPQDFPANVSGVKTVDFPNGEVAFRIVESEVRER
jgi:4-amino-4-deoxy-L-arabinose transferase-like glycosyltransferase